MSKLAHPGTETAQPRGEKPGKNQIGATPVGDLVNGVPARAASAQYPSSSTSISSLFIDARLSACSATDPPQAIKLSGVLYACDTRCSNSSRSNGLRHK